MESVWKIKRGRAYLEKECYHKRVREAKAEKEQREEVEIVYQGYQDY